MKLHMINLALPSGSNKDIILGRDEDGGYSYLLNGKGHEINTNYLWNRRAKEWTILVFEMYVEYAYFEFYGTKGFMESVRVDYSDLAKLGHPFYSRHAFSMSLAKESSSAIYQKKRRVRLSEISIHNFHNDVRLFFKTEKDGKSDVGIACDMPGLFFEEILKFSQDRLLRYI